MYFAIMMSVLSVEEKNRFQELYDEYNALMYYIAFHIVHDSGITEEILQETYLKMLCSFHLFAGGICDYSRNLLVVITRNTAYDYVRRQKTRQKYETDLNLEEVDQINHLYQKLDKKEQSAEQIFLEKVKIQDLAEAIRNLPEKEQAVIELRYSGKLKRKEIAELLSISESYVKKLIKSGLLHLKTLLEKE